MGTGISKPDGDEEATVPRRSIVTKFESFRWRRHPRREKNLSTLSTKQLLNCDEDSIADSKHGAESIHSDKDLIAEMKEMEGRTHVDADGDQGCGEEKEGENGEVEKGSEEQKKACSEGKKDIEKKEEEQTSKLLYINIEERKEEGKEEKEEGEEEGIERRKGEEEGKEENKEGEEKNKEGEEERKVKNKEGEEEGKEKKEGSGLIGEELGYGDFPGSPSFREYYYASIQGRDDSGENDENKEDDKKACCTDSNEEYAFKGKGKNRFKALARGPVVVCSLLNMRSCYHSRSTTDSPRLLEEKSSS